ncbi:MAG TPA: DUF3142 domain-containing protein [Pyrinomonadaceae bacterium]|nr:DUF3142 domain-containing protein [Pyrinomonadaceae bacterium]
MPRYPRLRSALCVFSLLGVLLLFAVTVVYTRRDRSNFNPALASGSDKLTKLPRTILWAWERPEQLDFLDTTETTVAFLAKTIQLRGARVVARPRLQPLKVPPGAPLIAVARIESDPIEHPALTSAQLHETAREIAELSGQPNVVAVQIDFDATLSERAFYRNLLFELRAQLRAGTALSITALASWCKGDNWLEELPIDEAVPMLFRMGIDKHQVLSQLNEGEPFTSSKCRQSAGVSTDEPIARLPATQRLYVFNPRSWSPTSVGALLQKKL